MYTGESPSLACRSMVLPKMTRGFASRRLILVRNTSVPYTTFGVSFRSFNSLSSRSRTGRCEVYRATSSGVISISSVTNRTRGIPTVASATIAAGVRYRNRAIGHFRRQVAITIRSPSAISSSTAFCLSNRSPRADSQRCVLVIPTGSGIPLPTGSMPWASSRYSTAACPASWDSRSDVSADAAFSISERGVRWVSVATTWIPILERTCFTHARSAVQVGLAFACGAMRQTEWGIFSMSFFTRPFRIVSRAMSMPSYCDPRNPGDWIGMSRNFTSGCRVSQTA